MKRIAAQPGRSELAYQALLDEICDGSLPAGTQLVQEELAAQLGVSRQPIQQALARLKGDGLLEEAPGRGLCVPPLDQSRMRSHYQIRSSLDRLAARLAASRVADASLDSKDVQKNGQTIIDAGNSAVSSETVKDMIHHDIAFHSYVYAISGNSLIEPAAEVHWQFLRRVMGDVLRRAEPPPSIWQQHEAILQAIVAGDPIHAEQLAEDHIELACDSLAQALPAEN